MSKVILGLFVGLFLVTANAQAHCGKCGIGDSPKEDVSAAAGEKAGKLAKQLSLTDEQKVKVEGLIKAKMEKKQQIMEEKHKAMDALQDDFKTQLKGVLTEEQIKKWEASKKDGPGDMGKCPMCKDGKKCEHCLLKKDGKGKCPACKEGKMCEACQHKKDMKGECPKCKDGKMCKECMRKKAKKE